MPATSSIYKIVDNYPAENWVQDSSTRIVTSWQRYAEMLFTHCQVQKVTSAAIQVTVLGEVIAVSPGDGLMSHPKCFLNRMISPLPVETSSDRSPNLNPSTSSTLHNILTEGDSNQRRCIAWAESLKSLLKFHISRTESRLPIDWRVWGAPTQTAFQTNRQFVLQRLWAAPNLTWGDGTPSSPRSFQLNGTCPESIVKTKTFGESNRIMAPHCSRWLGLKQSDNGNQNTWLHHGNIWKGIL